MKERTSKISNLMTLVVLCLFSVCVLLVLLTGADVYQRLVDSQQAHFEQRTVARYLSTRLHQGDAAGRVFVEDFEGHSTLVLQEEIDGELYSTRVYCYDGYVRELFALADGSFSPQDGEKVLETQDLEFALEDRMLTVTVTLCDGAHQQWVLYVRSGKEATA